MMSSIFIKLIFSFPDKEHIVAPHTNYPNPAFKAMWPSKPALVPCKPTHPKAKVSLWKNNQQFEMGESLMYNPKDGFHVLYPNAEYAGSFTCVFEYTLYNLTARETAVFRFMGKRQNRS